MVLKDIDKIIAKMQKNRDKISKLKLHTPYVFSEASSCKGLVLGYFKRIEIDDDNINIDTLPLYFTSLAYEYSDDMDYFESEPSTDMCFVGYSKIKEVKQEDLPLYINWHMSKHSSKRFKKFLNRSR